MTTSNGDERKSSAGSPVYFNSIDTASFDSASPLNVDVLTKMANAFLNDWAQGADSSVQLADEAARYADVSGEAIGLSDLAGVDHRPGNYRGVPSPGAFSSLPSPAASSANPSAYVNQAAQPFGFLEEIRPLFAIADAVEKDFNNLVDEFKLPGSFSGVQKSLDSQLVPTRASNDFLKGLTSVDIVPMLQPLDSRDLDLGLRAAQFDVNSIRRDFPILQERVFDHDLVWFDNAATTQKPNAVIDRLNHFYRHENSNIHRSAHFLAARSSDAYEAARESVRRFINARSINEIVFVRGATEAINLVAQGWGRKNLTKDDEVVISWLEHHANIVPWQIVCAETGAHLRVAPVDDDGDIIFAEFERLLGPRTKFVSITQVSNALGTVTPVQDIVEAAHRYGAKVLIDGAQSISHMPVDMQEYDCDFFVFSGHKVYAPTGIGALYGKEEVLNSMPPWQGGGNMIHDVKFERTIYQASPARFEAGTGNIADAVGLAAALEYISQIGMQNISSHEEELLSHATEELSRVPGLRILGRPEKRAGVLSFVMNGFRNEDVSQFLNSAGIAVRAGHHCAQPILRRFGVESSVRPSFAIYNTCDEVDVLVETLLQLSRARI
jgi:cysteine desulfurases, SufS subfamily